MYLYFNSDNYLQYWDLRAGANNLVLRTNAVFRDTSAWCHVVLAVDYSAATSTNRAKLYVNGVEQSYGVATYPNTTEDSYVNAAVAHYISDSSGYFNGYLADIYFIDGQALTPSSFTETDATTGQLIPKAFSGSYGSQGWHLEFADNSSNTATTLGKDTSGNGNNWSPQNLSVTAGAGNDSLVDVPTNGAQTDTGVGGEVRGNYCTLNPLGGKSTVTLANGNLERTGGANNKMGTIGMSSGKWYWEIVCTNLTGSAFNGVTQYSHEPDDYALNYTYNASGTKYVAAVETSYGASYAVNDVIGFAYDADNGSLVCYKNGVSQGTLVSGLSGKTLFPLTRSDSNAVMVCNFGQRPFAYTAPSGFKALCTANLPAPLVTKPNTAMDVVTYTGTGASRSITGLGFSPDFVWIKDRNGGGHNSYDIVRGASVYLASESTNAEGTDTDALTAFNSDGFSLGSGYTVKSANGSGRPYVAWAWDAGTGSAVSNPDGSISSQVRANTTAGFSIVTYTGNNTQGASVGHGLGVAPSMIIVKNRTSSGPSWAVGHTALGGWNKVLYLNLTDAVATQPEPFNGTTPTSTVFQLWDSSSTNSNGANYVAYCFAAVAGYSSFGSYTGNGSASGDGPFVFCNFRPRWILTKRTDSTNNWTIIDASRNSYNVSNSALFPNLSAQESTNAEYAFDILSNGFKVRGTPGDSVNVSGATYIYAAFAESPFNYARAR
jgi:hypothetical protein